MAVFKLKMQSTILTPLSDVFPLQASLPEARGLFRSLGAKPGARDPSSGRTWWAAAQPFEVQQAREWRSVPKIQLFFGALQPGKQRHIARERKTCRDQVGPAHRPHESVTNLLFPTWTSLHERICWILCTWCVYNAFTLGCLCWVRMLRVLQSSNEGGTFHDSRRFFFLSFLCLSRVRFFSPPYRLIWDILASLFLFISGVLASRGIMTNL